LINYILAFAIAINSVIYYQLLLRPI